jgi:V/A-type H+-transporting ATPase subunit D
MIARRAVATRSNQLRLQRRLTYVRKGVDLLTRKREALVAELMRRARPVVDMREAVDGEAAAAYPAMLEALAMHGGEELSAMSWPTRDVTVDIELTHVWGVPVPILADRPALVRSVAARDTAPPLVGPAAAAAAERFERLAELLLDTVPHDATMRRVGAALASTTRQVNTLQLRVAPTLEEQLFSIRQTLAERERDEHVRLRHLARRRTGRRDAAR